MKNIKFKKILCLILCLATVAAVAFTSGCSPRENEQNVQVEATAIGEGVRNFRLEVIGETARAFEVSTDEEIVGKALEKLGVISGEEGPYGMFITTVDGETVDFYRDIKYWAFYIDGTYATAGIDQTEIADGAVYSLKVEK